jgi:outer membrane lipoprotein LolB
MRNRNIIMPSPPTLKTDINNYCRNLVVAQKTTRFFLMSCFLLLITSCTTISNKNAIYSADGINPIKPPPLSWQISAKLGISSSQKNGSVTLNWQQTGETFVINLQGPLGQGNAVISGSQYNAKIQQPGQPTLRSNNVDELVFDTFGWTLPFDNFIHWVVATANPKQIITNISFDPALGTLSSFEQSGWAMEYSRYKLVDNWVLPGRIKAKRLRSNSTQQNLSYNSIDTQQTTLTLIIREWTIL